MASTLSFTEGKAPFSVAGIATPCETAYKIYGSLRDSERPPLVIVHGGPGSTHDYLLPLVNLHTTYGIPLVFYDQIGNGKSTHLREKMGDEGFWVEELFMDELDNLLKVIGLEGGRYDVLGHSWGGMLAMRWAGTRQRQGLRKLVVSCSPASMGLLVEGTVQLRRELPRDIQDALDGHEAAGTTDSAEYRAAEQAFYARHLCRIAPMPEGLVASFEAMSEDPTVYHTMNGPSEFHIVGSLKTWDVRGDLCKICVPTLLLNGRYDEVQDVAVQPLFEGIEKVKWVQFGESSHLPFVEESSRYKQVVAGFLE